MSRVISPSHPLKQLGTLLAAALILLSGMSSFHAPITAAASTKTLQALADGNLLFPSWWNGECDSINYRKKTGKDSYPLGGSYRGVKACGPRGGLTIVNFGTGTSQYEWQCVELVMRYMYLAFGQAPYNVPKGGKDVVAYYPGTALEKITNGTPGKAPRPGDVIAYGGYTNNPNHTHTSIVVAAAVDANGNGSIDTLNQNMSIWDARSAQGYRTERVRNWSLENGALGWLTPKGNVPPNTPQQLSPIHGAVMNTRTVTLQWQDTGDPDNGPQAHRDFYVEVQRGTEPPLLVLAWKPQQTWAITVPSDGTYVWRVRSGDTAPINGASAWSANRLFTVITGPCARKIEGDANCDGVINLQDFELFRQEYIAQRNGSRTTNRADFNQDGIVDLLDFALFREGFIQDRRAGTLLGRAASTTDGPGSEFTGVYVQQTHYSISQDGAVDIDVFMDNNPATQASSTDLTLEYNSNLLEYDTSAATYLSPTCTSANDNLGYLNQSPSVFDDAMAGILRVSRMSTAETSTLPYGKFCAGTFRFRVKSGISLPSTATVRLRDGVATVDTAGPQAALSPTFDAARQQVTVVIGAAATPPGTPTDGTVKGVSTTSITLSWNDTSHNEDGFDIYVWNSDQGTWDYLDYVGPNITEYTQGDLPPGTEHRYHIRAYNDQGHSDATETITGMTDIGSAVFLPVIIR